MLVVIFLVCINHSRYLISQKFLSPKECWIIILCGRFMCMISFIHQFDYICWYPGIGLFFKRIVLNGACFALISKNVDFHSSHDGVPLTELSLKMNSTLCRPRIYLDRNTSYPENVQYYVCEFVLKDNASGPPYRSESDHLMCIW